MKTAEQILEDYEAPVLVGTTPHYSPEQVLEMMYNYITQQPKPEQEEGETTPMMEPLRNDSNNLIVRTTPTASEESESIERSIERLDEPEAEGEEFPSDRYIQLHIERNTRNCDGTPAMDEQTFYEGAKWMRNLLQRLVNIGRKHDHSNPAASEEGKGVFVFTFDEFVDYGLLHSDNIVDGMPWSFDFYGHQVTHENDRCYLIGDGESITPSNLLIIANRELIIKECPQCKALRDALTEVANKPTHEAITKMSDLSNINMNEPYCTSNASEESESNREGEIDEMLDMLIASFIGVSDSKDLSWPDKHIARRNYHEKRNMIKAALSASNNVPTEKEIQEAKPYCTASVLTEKQMYAQSGFVRGVKWAINKMKKK